MFPVISRGALGAPLLFLIAGACAPFISKTPVHGDRASIEQLVGDWEGTYSSTESGRTGDIRFSLISGSDTAQGAIVMTGARMAEVSHGDVNSSMARVASAPAQVVTIRFVMAAGAEVRGALDPYRDPDCGCALTTTFRGHLAGDVIEGTFASEGSGIFHVPTSGPWRVTRTRSAK
jgi:hypothetical protein